MRSTCVYDPAVLPRVHQADRGTDFGWHQLAPEGAYNRVRPWDGRQHWLTFVVPVAIAFHRGLFHRQIDAKTFRDYALVKSGYAAAANGRRCIVEPKTLASVLGRSTRHVQRMNDLARRIGLEVVIVHGRMLTKAEKLHLWRLGKRKRGFGSRQRGLSTEVALTIPADLPLEQGVVTPGGTSPPDRRERPVTGVSPSGASADMAEPASPAQPTKRRGRHPATDLAHELVRTVPWLRSERPRRLIPALARFAMGQPVWTAQDVADAIAELRFRRGIDLTLTEERIRTRPAVVLAAFLRQIDVQADHPGLARSFDPAPPVPCDRPDCDGHGWIELPDGAVSKCPDCPPPVRTWRPDDQLLDLDEHGEPSF